MFQKSDRKAFWVPCKGHGACAQREQTGLISYRIYRINVSGVCLISDIQYHVEHESSLDDRDYSGFLNGSKNWLSFVQTR